MNSQEIVEVVGELVLDDGETLEQLHGSRALAVAQEMVTTLAPRLENNPAYAPLWQQFQAAPQEQAPALEGILKVLLNADAALARRLDKLLDEYRQAKGSARSEINTGGGAYVGGSVSVSGGDFVGRDKTTITGDGNVIGDHSSSTVIKQGVDPEAVARAFRALYSAVEQKPNLPPQDKADLKAELQELETEVVKGEDADEGFIARRLRYIKRMAPDILEVVVATLINPVSGISTVAKKVAERMRQEMDNA